ncbi:MAG: DUF1566 domain-containing protein [Campylobacterales bacterium]|nr:DUF1566 domain-containing protein [Campylobacterales bacterium]
MKKALLSLTLITILANAEMIRIDNKEVVIDTDTELMWQDSNDAKTVRKKWQDSINYCENLSFAGFNDWRLPDKETLNALYPNKEYLTNVVNEAYWSSSRGVFEVGFYDGYVLASTRNSNYYVRCVRSMKPK